MTQKELKEFRKNRSKVEESEVPVQVAKPLEPEVEASTEEHFLFHPDNPSHRSGYLSGERIVRVGDTEFKVPMLDGVLRTDNVEVKNELIKQGFVFMYTKPKE